MSRDTTFLLFLESGHQITQLKLSKKFFHRSPVYSVYWTEDVITVNILKIIVGV